MTVLQGFKKSMQNVRVEYMEQIVKYLVKVNKPQTVWDIKEALPKLNISDVEIGANLEEIRCGRSSTRLHNYYTVEKDKKKLYVEVDNDGKPILEGKYISKSFSTTLWSATLSTPPKKATVGGEMVRRMIEHYEDTHR